MSGHSRRRKRDPLSGAVVLPWDGITVLVATPSSSPTSRNLQATGKVRLGIYPQRLQAWREANELKDRELMRGGQWVVP